MAALGSTNPVSTHKFCICLSDSPKQKPIFIALVVLGIVGFGGFAIGLASYGAQQGYWMAGGLTHLGQVNAMTLLAAGITVGLPTFLIGIIGLVKSHTPKEKIPDQTAEAVIIDETVWQKCFGTVEKAPPLPFSLAEELEKNCPFSNDPKIKVKNTHMLIYMPKTVNGHNLSIHLLQECTTFIHKNPLQNLFITSAISEAFGKQEINAGYWYLITRGIVPNQGMNYTQQAAFIKQCDSNYRPPHLIELFAAMVLEYAAYERRLYSEKYPTYSYCLETIEGNHTICGNFTPDGPSLKLYFENMKVEESVHYGMSAVKVINEV